MLLRYFPLPHFPLCRWDASAARLGCAQEHLQWQHLPRAALAVPLSLPQQGPGRFPPLLPLCFWVLKTKQRCWPGARREVAPGGLDKVLEGRSTSPLGLAAARARGAFPCSAVFWGQEGLHCKMAFQDFLQQPLGQDAAVHQLPGEPAGMLGCPGVSPQLLSEPAPGQTSCCGAGNGRIG